jgi:hypothetical protein
MKLASLKAGGRDGTQVVSRDLRGAAVPEIARACSRRWTIGRQRRQARRRG